MKRVYRTLLLLYPVPYRALYGREMANVFEDTLRDCDARGFLNRVAFLWREFSGVFAAAFALRIGESVRRERPFAPSLASGAAAAAFGQFLLFSNCGIGKHLSIGAEIADTQQPPDALQLPLLMAAVCVFLILTLCITFVWNMRNIGRRRE